METVPDKDGTVIKLIGWLRAEYLPELAKTGTSSRPVVLEMAEVLVEAGGIENPAQGEPSKKL